MDFHETRPPACWFCAAAFSASQLEVASVLEVRDAAHGGPFLTVSCPACRTRCGALRSRRGEWLVYPLEGAAAPTLLDRLVPRTSRAHLLRGRRWWLRNAGDVERFRDPTRDRRPPGRSAPPPPRRPPPTKRRESAPRTPAGPRAVLDVAADASLADVRRAWRAAVKRWHPDRIPTRDPVVVEEAHRRFAELRAAYEALVAELSR